MRDLERERESRQVRQVTKGKRLPVETEGERKKILLPEKEVTKKLKGRKNNKGRKNCFFEIQVVFIPCLSCVS